MINPQKPVINLIKNCNRFTALINIYIPLVTDPLVMTACYITQSINSTQTQAPGLCEANTKACQQGATPLPGQVQLCSPTSHLIYCLSKVPCDRQMTTMIVIRALFRVRL